MPETFFDERSSALLADAPLQAVPARFSTLPPAAAPAGEGEPITSAPYSAEISRNHPACFLFLLDQSSSMKDPWGGKAGINKADTIASIINRLLQNLVLKCTKEDAPRDYFHIGVLGYGRTIASAFLGELAGKNLLPVSDLANYPARMEQKIRQEDHGTGFFMDRPVRYPVWIDPVADGGTPMCGAFSRAVEIVTEWTARHPHSFPPVVFHLTDGASTDGDPSEVVKRLTSVQTSDGNTLLFNAHISSRPAEPLLFPASDAQMQSDYSRWLFQMSSPLTPTMRSLAEAEGHHPRPGSRGFVFNADPGAITHFLDLGTRPQNFR